MSNDIQSKKKLTNQIIWLTLMGFGFFLLGISVLFVITKLGEQVPITDGFSTIPIEVNFPAPQISLSDLSSQNVSLSDYKNSIVLVNNWATWCPPCKAEMPTLQEYYLTHAQQGFIIIAIESGESIDEVTDFVQNYSLTFPVWIDTAGIALEAFNNWDLPSSYVIDRTGTVRLTWTGQISMEMLNKYVSPLLEK
jgi:peroxiredoxin